MHSGVLSDDIFKGVRQFLQHSTENENGVSNYSLTRRRRLFPQAPKADS